MQAPVERLPRQWQFFPSRGPGLPVVTPGGLVPGSCKLTRETSETSGGRTAWRSRYRLGRRWADAAADALRRPSSFLVVRVRHAVFWVNHTAVNDEHLNIRRAV